MSGGDFEFGGPIGAVLMLVGLPLTVYGITLICNKDACDLAVPDLSREHLPTFWSWSAVILLSAWLVLQLALYCLLPAQHKQGMKLHDGTRLTYPCNGFAAFVVSVVGFLLAWVVGLPVTVLYTQFLPLVTVTTVLCVAGSALLYIKSYTVPEEELAHGGNTGYVWYDLFLGRELNPRVGGVDLKFFCELRPGLIGWVLLDLAFCAQAHEWHGAVPVPLILVTLFHTIYVADALWFEECILTTMDIVHDGFGFMLLFGDLVWVPCLYSLQARFLLEHPQDMSGVAVVAVLLLNALGYTIFRKSNSQKNLFRKDPTHEKVSHLETLETSTGRKLIVSGWWGLCRHPNYLGDLLMALAWSLPCGVSHILPYFYPLYFLGLLVHRFERDAQACRDKYGADWDKYCKRVPYKIIPYVY